MNILIGGAHLNGWNHAPGIQTVAVRWGDRDS